MALEGIQVSVGATVANLGSGFDIFGLALDTFRDLIRVRLVDEGIVIVSSGEYGTVIPLHPKMNTAGRVAELFLEKTRANVGIELDIRKNIRPGFGLGSSGASAAGVAVALDRLLGTHYSTNQLIAIAAEGEIVSSGSPHADNVAAAILGGFAIVTSYDPIEAIGLSVPKELELALVVPNIKMPEWKTSFARLILPDRIKLSQMVYNMGRSSTLVAGFASGDIDLIGKGMTDCVVEPLRAKLIPGYEKVKKNAMACGASGVAICGSGPSMIAAVDHQKESAKMVSQIMKETFEDEGIETEAYCVKSGNGVRTKQSAEPASRREIR